MCIFILCRWLNTDTSEYYIAKHVKELAVFVKHLHITIILIFTLVSIIIDNYCNY